MVNPPADSNGASTRYLVLQRALASIGICFEYHIRAVSCEAFAMTMMAVDPKWSSAQLKVIKIDKKVTKEALQKDR